MICHLACADTLSDPVLECCQLDLKEQTWVKSQSKFMFIRSRKCIWKCRLQYVGHLVSASMCINGQNEWMLTAIWNSSQLHFLSWSNSNLILLAQPNNLRVFNKVSTIYVITILQNLIGIVSYKLDFIYSANSPTTDILYLSRCTEALCGYCHVTSP